MTPTTCTFRPWVDAAAKANRKICPDGDQEEGRAG